ncbi:hypothetical protein B0H14DRAFT_3127858 [Mycena olivaceomarginata]|nr:hypothetical protein B0H14DRAFT_3127858 [Mycena olivaceomarginata]
MGTSLDTTEHSSGSARDPPHDPRSKPSERPIHKLVHKSICVTQNRPASIAKVRGKLSALLLPRNNDSLKKPWATDQPSLCLDGDDEESAPVRRQTKRRNGLELTPVLHTDRGFVSTCLTFVFQARRWGPDFGYKGSATEAIRDPEYWITTWPVASHSSGGTQSELWIIGLGATLPVASSPYIHLRWYPIRTLDYWIERHLASCVQSMYPPSVLMYPRLFGTQFELWIIGLSAILPVVSNSCIWVWIQYNLTSHTYINIWALGDYWIGVPSPFGVPVERSWNSLNHNRRDGRPPDDNHSYNIPVFTTPDDDIQLDGCAVASMQSRAPLTSEHKSAETLDDVEPTEIESESTEELGKRRRKTHHEIFFGALESDFSWFWQTGSVRPRPKALTPKALDFFDLETRPWPSLGLSRVAIIFHLRLSPTMALVANPLSAFFHRGDAQNKSMYFTYCKACVTEELRNRGAMATLQTFKDGSSSSFPIRRWSDHRTAWEKEAAFQSYSPIRLLVLEVKKTGGSGLTEQDSII